jgi:hypothetical protein
MLRSAARTLEARHQVVDGLGDRRDLHRQRVLVERRQIVLAACGDVAAKPPNRRKAAAYDQPDTDEAERHEHGHRPADRERGLDLRVPARRQRFGHQQRERALQARFGIDAMRCARNEARLQVRRKNALVRVVRAQQRLALRVSHDVGQQFQMGAHGGGPAAVVAVRVAPENVHDRERQQTLCGFLQRAVRDPVDLLAQHVKGGCRRSQRQRDESRHQRSCETPLQAARHHGSSLNR